MNVVTELGVRVKKAVTGKPTLADLEAEVTKAGKGAADAAMAVTRKQDELRLSFEDLAAGVDELAVRRIREEIVEAQRWQERAEEDLRHHRHRFERARVANVQAVQSEAITEFERLSQLLYVRAQRLVDHVHELTGELEAYLHIAIDLQRQVDSLLVRQRTAALAAAVTEEQTQAARKLRTAVTANEYPALFDTATVLHLIGIDLYVGTQGKWPHKNIGLDLYALSQGPKFDDRSRDYLRLLQRNLIEAGVIPAPPPKAA